MSVRNFQWACRQPKFGRRARNRFQARAIGRRVTQLPNPCQAYLATKVPADHAQTGGTAIHLIDLHDVIDFSEALAVFAEQTSLVGKWLFLVVALLERLLTWLLCMALHFVVHLCVGRTPFVCAIDANARFGFFLITGQPLA